MYQIYFKRLFDILFSIILIIFLSPVMILVFFFVWLNIGFPIFKQKRPGLNNKVFTLYKFKTLHDIKKNIPENKRVNKIGNFLRITGLDELPQLFNILFNKMSFVGPRSDVPGYADKLEGKNKQILLMRPGITGPAQLFFKNEESILAQHKDARAYNDEVIWPKKVKMNLDYVLNYSFLKDFHYIWKTLVK